jgi:hypothetical protein
MAMDLNTIGDILIGIGLCLLAAIAITHPWGQK